jgi:hypothetical protein
MIHNSVGIAPRIRVGQLRNRSLIPDWGQSFYFCCVVSRLALRPAPPTVEWVWEGGGLFLPGVKRRRLEADHSPPSRAEVKNGCICISAHTI